MSLSSKISSRIFRDLRTELNNKRCFDCPEKNPQWTSVPYGIYLCVNCATVHRRMGTHISFVRSTTLDRWSPTQIMHLMVGGNRNAFIFFKKHGWVEENADSRTAKYISKAAVKYKQHVQKLIVQQKSSLMAKIDTEPQKKATPPLRRGSDGLEALIRMEEEKSKSRSALKMQSRPEPAPKPQIPQKKKIISSSLQAKIKAQPPARRVIIRSKKERKKTSRVVLSKSRPKSKLTTNLSTSSRRRNILAVNHRHTLSNDDDLDAALSSLKVIPVTVTQAKPKKVEPVAKSRVEERKEYEQEQKKIQEAETRRKDDQRLSKYDNAKSIGSDQYFERGDWAATSLQDKMRLEKFSSASAIGSDAFFDREQGRDSQAYNIPINYDSLSSLSTNVGEKGRQLGGYASKFYNGMKASYNQSG